VIEKLKDPSSYTWLTYLWVSLWAMLGGAVNFYAKIKTGQARPFNLVEGIGELATSSFVGILTFWLCEWGRVDPLLSACFIGISGHMGSRVMFTAERHMQSYFLRRAGLEPRE
jgi:predicted CDP-diglyceride synthetase/phosphatidate cytidylyltransferase